MRIILLIFFLLQIPATLHACCEKDSLSKKESKKRLIIVGAGANTLYVGSMIGLSQALYKNQPRTAFHFFNDNREWLQIDKVGHFTTSFHESYFGVEVLKWCGFPEKKAIWIGSLAGFVYQTTIEILDRYSTEY